MVQLTAANDVVLLGQITADFNIQKCQPVCTNKCTSTHTQAQPHQRQPETASDICKNKHFSRPRGTTAMLLSVRVLCNAH